MPAARWPPSTSAANPTAWTPRTLAISRAWRPGARLSCRTASRPIPRSTRQTGELLFFNYSKQAPYMHFGVVDANDTLVHYVPVELPGPRLPHDMAFTEHYAIVNDFPLFWDPELLAQGKHKVVYRPELPSRFGIVPRRGKTRRGALVRGQPHLCAALAQRLGGRRRDRAARLTTRRRRCRPAATARAASTTPAPRSAPSATAPRCTAGASTCAPARPTSSGCRSCRWSSA